MANLKQALTELREEQTSEYEELMKKQARHKFSRIYLKRRKAVIDMTSQAAKAMHDDYKYRAVKRFSLRTALVAAIVMILATVSVIAIAKPEIIFNIKEKITHWKIEVRHENTEERSDEFVLLRPDAPDGYEIVDEIEEGSYYIIYRNAKGDEIVYEQNSGNPNIYLDSEGIDIYETTINGHKAIISRHSENATTIIIEDGEYLYLISGHCPFEDVYDFAEKLPTLN